LVKKITKNILEGLAIFNMPPAAKVDYQGCLLIIQGQEIHITFFWNKSVEGARRVVGSFHQPNVKSFPGEGPLLEKAKE
jgi:hypothetical protein